MQLKGCYRCNAFYLGKALTGRIKWFKVGLICLGIELSFLIEKSCCEWNVASVYGVFNEKWIEICLQNLLNLNPLLELSKVREE